MRAPEVAVGMVFKDAPLKGVPNIGGRTLQVVRVEDDHAVCLEQYMGRRESRETRILTRRLMSADFDWVETLGAG